MKKFTLRLDEETKKKLQVIAQHEHRSVSSYIISLAEKCVRDHEAVHGPIPPAKDDERPPTA